MIHFVVGGVALFVSVGATGLAARQLRQRLLPWATGVVGAVATTIITISMLTLVMQALGTIGLFAAVPLTVACVALGCGIVVAGDRLPGVATVDLAPLPAHKLGRPAQFFAGFTTIAVAGEWLTRTVDEVRTGITSIDSLWYHLPIAARFAASGEIFRMHRLEEKSLTTFYPANSSLFHGMGIEFLGTDLLTVLSSLAVLLLLLMAAWAVGQPFGLAPITTGAAAVSMLLPALLSTQPGSAYNDAVGTAFLVGAIALFVHFEFRSRARAESNIPGWLPVLILIGAAIGLAAGTKFQFLIPAATLALGVVAVSRSGTILIRFATMATSVALLGSYWYIRNIALTGNPLPALEFELGPVSLPYVDPGITATGFIEHTGTAAYWSDYYFPGLDQAFGALWPALVAVLVLGLVIGLATGRHVAMLCTVATISLLSFLISPAAYQWNGVGAPVNFTVALRYLVAGVTIGVVMVPVGLRRHRNLLYGVIAALTAVTVAVLVDDSDWPDIREMALDEPVWNPKSLIGYAVVAALLAAGYWVARDGDRRKTIRGNRRPLRSCPGWRIRLLSR